ncbi:hypothetical protein QYM36_001463 [Artemia franciscana]|uniref:Ion transport domain-containing protein n=1 Tax=Artemia franciscana TaxID=6661 RepID=A0AA88I9D9_ARTSF|nr:hypothetical protein QYM36_001463 [Artemia franciscana]
MDDSIPTCRTFFQPADQQVSPAAANTSYEGLAYFGELPLAWATCVANETAYNMLIEKGADPNARDTYGNMVLHMVVICDKLSMYGYAMRHPRRPAKPTLINLAGLTPLALACEMARAQIFLEMMELSALEFWRYSNITCSAYPLSALDTIRPDGETNWSSALMIILNGTKEEHVDMLDGGIIQRLLEEKWKTFAQNQFMKRLVIHFIHLLFLSVAVYLRPTKTQPTMKQFDQMDTYDYVRLSSELGVILSSVAYLILQLGLEIVNQGIVSFLKGMAQSPPKVVFFFSNILILAAVPCRLLGLRVLEDGIMVVAVPMAWFYLMFFAGAVKLTGPFVTMIYKMITGDMLTFAIIFVVILFGFSQAFFFLHKPHPQKDLLFFSNYPTTWMALLMMTLGDYNYSAFNETIEPPLTKIIFAIFMVLVPILLLNMLIASMGNTYSIVSERSEKEWVKQWAKLVIALERSLKAEAAKDHLLTYSIKLPSFPGGEEDGTPPQVVCGVMVIKSKSKTRANQRKGALSNWKRVGKITINELRRYGITGEEMRKKMWDVKSSSATPLLSPYPVTKQNSIPKADAIGDALVQLAWQRCTSPVDSLNLSIGPTEQGAKSLEVSVRYSLERTITAYEEQEDTQNDSRLNRTDSKREHEPLDFKVIQNMPKIEKLPTWNGNQELLPRIPKFPTVGPISDEKTNSPLILVHQARQPHTSEETDWDENRLGIKYGGLGISYMPKSTARKRSKSGIKRQNTAIPPPADSEPDDLTTSETNSVFSFKLFDEPHIDSSLDYAVTDILLSALREDQERMLPENKQDEGGTHEISSVSCSSSATGAINENGSISSVSTVRDAEFIEANPVVRPKSSFPFRNGKVTPYNVDTTRRISSSRNHREERTQTIDKAENFLEGFWTKPETDKKCKVARGRFRQNGVNTIARILDWSVDEEI